MGPEIRQIVYASRATRPIAPAELGEILEAARRNNEANSITGMLLYRKGHFLQVLEGPPDPLRALLKKIALDDRHRNVRVLLDSLVPARAFGTWSMAFQDVSAVKADQLPAYSNFLSKGFSSTECVRYPHKALKMILAFRDTDLAKFETLTAQAPALEFAPLLDDQEY